MADTLVARVAGRKTSAKPKIEVKIVMTADSLANNADQPAMVEGFGPVPATWARETLTDAEVFVRRLLTDPARPPCCHGVTVTQGTGRAGRVHHHP